MRQQPATLLRVSRRLAYAMPLLLAFTLSSCTSTGGGSIEMAAASLQPPVAPQQSNQNVQLSGPAVATQQMPAPTPVGQVSEPTLSLANTAPVDNKAQVLVPPASTPPGQIVIAGPALPNAAPDALAQPQTIKMDDGTVLAVPTLNKKANAAPQIATAEPVAPVIISNQAEQPVIDPTAPVSVAQAELPTAKAQAANTAEITPEAGVQNLTAPVPVVAEAVTPERKKTLFESMFGSSKKPAAQNVQESPAAPEVDTQLALAAPPSAKAFKPVALSGGNKAKNLELAKLESTPDIVDSGAENGDLPGVRKGALFEIKRRDSASDNLDVDISETDGGPVQLASAAGMARLAPNGLRVQRESVDVACLKPQLVKMLKTIEGHYGQSLVVTSGYRSPGHNRKVRGAKNSLHMYCAAADIQVPGVGKWALAKYLRNMPERGGVGTYCNTESVHVDVGPDRDWNWRCSRRK